MLEGNPPSNGSVVPASSFPRHIADHNRLFQQHSFQPGPNVISPFSQHLSPGAMGSHHGANSPHTSAQQQAGGIQSMSHHSNCGMPSLPNGLSSASQSLAAALFANSPLISDDLKLAAAAAAAAATAQSRGKKTHRAEPVPQSGFKGVRMKAWLAFYVTENGERKSKTFSTRKLGMEEARLQAIAFCRQKQDQRREARKRNRGLQNSMCGSHGAAGSGGGTGQDKLSSDESLIGSPSTIQQQHHRQQETALRCGYPTTPGMALPNGVMSASNPLGVSPQGSNNSEIAYVPIVPIALDMIEKSGLLQPLELNVLPPCQHCNKQPYPFLMIVSEGQEQTYSGSSIMSLASHSNPGTNNVGDSNQQLQQSTNRSSGMIGPEPSNSPTTSDASGAQSPTGGDLNGLIKHGGTASQNPVNNNSEDHHLSDQSHNNNDSQQQQQVTSSTVGRGYGQDILQVKLQEEDESSDSDLMPGASNSTSAFGMGGHLIHHHHNPNSAPTPARQPQFTLRNNNAAPNLLSSLTNSLGQQTQRSLLQHISHF